MCIYWTFVDWPSHMLTRTFAWPCFSILRSTIIADIDGAMSYITRAVLRTFFPLEGASLERGILIQSKDGHYMVRAVFAGFLADLLGHKEITEWKGTGGNVCCIECSNVHKRARGPNDPRGVGLDCADQTKYARRSNEEVFAIVDTLAIQNTILTVAQFEKEETRLGFNFVANGLLMDHSLRGIYKPVDHTIRDWQHTLTSDGCANTCIAETLHLLPWWGYLGG